MNTLFSWKRFAKLFKKHSAEHYKNYLLSVVVIFGILLLLLCYVQFQNRDGIGTNQQAAYFMILFPLLGTIFTSSIFADFSINKRAIAALTLPASHFEKFLVAWIHTYLLFQVVYVLGFYLVIYLVLNIGNAKDQQVELFRLSDPNTKPYVIFIGYAFLHAATLLGAVAFKKWHFIKTASILLACWFLVFVINAQTIKYLLDRDVSAMPFLGVTYVDNNSYYYIDITENIIPYIFTLTILISILLWTSTYFRLKEKQG